VFEILSNYNELQDWAAAFDKAIPKRKGVTLKDKNGNDGEKEDESIESNENKDGNENKDSNEARES
jgi:hypothetical protein